MPLPKLYCDMDGVLADFKKGAEKATGVPISQWMNLTKRDKWNPIRNDSKFWETLPWMSDGKQLWNYIKKHSPDILSAYVDKNVDPNCIPGKTKWCRSQLGLSGRRVNLVKRSQKQNYAQTGYRSPAVLIDDYKPNTDGFTARGGIGIFHRNTANTIRELKKLGF
jgi:hypothetical protein|tara:strand:- start:1113 stop:1607 length:495 start_codon:yes stop_codon:yes gene_type:complete